VRFSDLPPVPPRSAPSSRGAALRAIRSKPPPQGAIQGRERPSRRRTRGGPVGCSCFWICEIDGSIPSASETSADTGAHMKSSTHSDQSSEHSKMEHAEQDEQRDSSPSFDVLVDDRDSNKNDFGHQLAGERDVNGPYVEYDGGDSVGYGLDCLDLECYEHEFFGFDSACYPVDSFYPDRLNKAWGIYHIIE
jgi:hypothetical protein